MANLKPCKTCGKEISTEAKTCPHCGQTNPTASGSLNTEIGFGAAILAVLAVFAIIGAFSHSGARGSSSAPKLSSAECRKNLQCWADENSSDAQHACAKKIEGLGRYSFEWTNRTFEPKFSRISWVDEKKGSLRYNGDKIKFQNGFGAWQPHIYYCEFDPSSKTVLDYGAAPGRMGG